MRNIEWFTGDTCIVGRGWAEAYVLKDNKPVFSGEQSWYRTYDKEQHDPGKSYYIDSERYTAADLVIDFGDKLSPELIPDGRFDRVILEFLPIDLFEKGRFTLDNAVRITSQGGTVEVHSAIDVLNKVSGEMKGHGLDSQIAEGIKTVWCDGDIEREYFKADYVGKGYEEQVPVSKLICRRK